MADAIPPIKVSVVADTSGLKTGVDQATKGIKEIENSVRTAQGGMSNFIGKLKQVGSTLGVVFAGQQVVSFFKDAVNASLEAEAAQDRLRNLLLNTNGATEAQIKALGEQAKALEKVGVVSADNITVAQSQLATFDLSANAIQKLTPAILDYVTAEKGASASSDDYKQMTNSLAQAMAGNFASLTKVGFVLDETTKKQISQGTEMERSQAIVDVLNSTYKDFNKNLRDTSAGGLQVAINDFNNLKQQIGDALQPVIDAFAKFLSNVLLPALSKLVEFLTKNKDTIVAVAKVLAIGVTAFMAYKAAIVITSATSAAFQVVMTLMKGAQLASIASTNGLAASMLVLNAVMKANPIGVFITAVTLAVAAIVILWKNCDWFREAVIKVAKVALNAFASIIPMVGKVYEAIAKVGTGPLRLLLSALSHLPGVGKYAKAGLDVLNTGLDKISDFADSASKKAKELSSKLDEMGKKADSAGKKTKDAVKKPVDWTKPGGEDKGGGGLDPKIQKKLDDNIKKAKSLQKDIQDAIDEANDKALEALNTRNEKMAEANQNYLEREAELNKNYKEAMADAEKNYNEKVLDINKTYDAKELDLLKAKTEKIKDLETKAEEQRTKLIQAAADKRQSIIQQSIDRLRDAFASKTGFNIADAFGAGATTGGSLLAKLKEQLTGAKDLQANAGALAAAGYSQTFIEQVVKQGPEVGNQIAKALKEATPEETAALQASFAEMEKVQNSGLDALAASMNSGAKLATDELRKAYEQVSIDLVDSLSAVDVELKKGLAEANANYQEAMTQSKIDRDAALADALKTFTEAKAKAQKTLDEGLAEAQKTLQDALIKAQKDYEDAIDKINKATQKKIEELKIKLAEVMALIAAISAAQAAVVAAKTPVYTPITAVPSPSTTTLTPTSTTVINNNISGVNLSDPKLTADSVSNAIKYGNVITVYDSPWEKASKNYNLSTSINTATGVANKIGAMGGKGAYFE